MSFHRTIIRLSAVLASLALGWACGGDSATAPEPARPTTVTVSPATHELTALGTTVQLSAEVRDQNARVMAGATVTWTSSASLMATVDASGLVTAAGNGTATITASAGSASGSAVVTVMQSVASVEVSPSVDELTALGQTVQLTAEAFDENGHAVAGAEFSWESSDAAVATVDARGLVTAVAEGVATITASAGSASGSAVVTVTQSVPSVQVSPSAETIELGSTLQLTAEAFDESGHAVAEVEFAWETSDATVATVDASGLVTGVAVGVATITASAGEVAGSAVVTVMQPVASVEVSPSAETIGLGSTLQLTAEAFDENGHAVAGVEFAWESSDRAVATVDGSGLVTAIAEGTATITATAGDARGTAEIAVENPDRAALVALYNATGGRNWRRSDNWLTDAPLDEWYGVRTDSRGRVDDLRLRENNLTGSIPPEFGRLSRMTTLQLWGNQIDDISGLAGLTNLETLLIGQNNITDISALAGLTNLTELSVGDANIQDVSLLAGLTNLTSLRVIAANIQDEDVSLLSGLTNLRQLALSHNRIADISPLAELTGLTGLWLWDNQVENISALSGLTNLTFLSLGKNNINAISPLAGLTNLTELLLNDNNITDVSPLSRLTNLRELNLSANNITDVSPLSRLTNLRELNLSANNITDISPLSGLSNLRDLDLRGNPYETLPKGDFDIELVLLDEFTESEKNVLQYVARRWMAVITEDLPDYEFSEGWSGRCGSQSIEISAGDRIDDLRIYVKKEQLSVRTLGFGGPMVVREASHLSVLGCMGLDLSHANLLITGLHEIAHVLGVGALWTELGYFQNPSDADQHFNGPLAIAAFDAAGGRDYSGAKVPVEGGHWRGSVFGDELMTPGGTGALSAITVQSLADLGYVVDITQADPYTLPAAVQASAMQAVVIPAIPGEDRSSGRLLSHSSETEAVVWRRR